MVAIAGDGPARASAAERASMHSLFAQLCAIESPSGREQPCLDRIAAELADIGVAVCEDNAGLGAGSECGNLLARIPARQGIPSANAGTADGLPAPSRPGVVLCAHMDTVPPQAPIVPVLREGVWENEHDGIIGADNKAAIAVILAVARHVRARGGPPVDVEILFTVCEELALAGARQFDASSLAGRCAYVFDHATPIGELVMSSPSHYRIDVDFHGASAHSGLRPEDGRSAILAAAHAIARMPHGRIDELTTANVGSIAGGSAINVVPERCTFVAEVRSHDEERAEEVIAEIVDRIHEAANLPQCECDVDLSVHRTFSSYRLKGTDPVVAAAESALRACGHEPVQVSSAGASDANALIAMGLPTLNFANGTERNHEPGERVSELALDQMLDVALALVDTLAATTEHPGEG
jgi:tripeptide aminopeptidase